ncbi:PREDICTED: uncharacterized protein LOC108660722 [Theobroma cacao]|uniref:Uncharacterized protein LOC108660722 n=1 Tax=Theobroma cacao TaxID=3641 RepID=A0AB32VYM1_THECC|nr:PREDICTED: uncharacterized protein LOC108660722 [Theobroma cacao]
MIAKYIAEDVRKQKFMIGNFYHWKMTDDKDIKSQINEYHKLVDDLKVKKINLQEEFVVGLLIEKLPESWNGYKQQLKHKEKQLSLADLIVHIIIEDTTRREIKASKAKEITTKANLVQGITQRQQRYPYELDHKPKAPHPTFKKKGSCFVCGKPGHHAAQCKKRTKGNDKPANPKVNLVKADESDDVIVAVISQANMVAIVKEWVVDSGEGEETIYLGDSRTAQVLGKRKVLLKLASGKTLALNDVLHVPNIRANLVSVAY